MSPHDLADLLQIPLSTLYSWSYRGVGPPVLKIGRHLRYRRAAVEAWLREQEAAS